jgi:subfamily B ATP-binding cassette protein MsbA
VRLVTGRRSLIGRISQILRLAQAPAWASPLIILLGVAVALLEGFGLILFVPLLQSLGAPASRSSVQPLFDALLQRLPEQGVTAALVGLLFLCIVLKNAVSTGGVWIARKVDGLVGHRLRTQIFDQTLSSCIDYRVGARRAEIATTITGNSWKVGNALAVLYRAVISLLTIIVFAVLMVGISPTLTLIALAFLAAVAGIMRVVTRRAEKTGQAVVEENRQFGIRMWESIESLQLIRAFGREEFERRRLSQTSDNVRRRMLTLDLLWAAPGAITEIAICGVIGGLILAAASTGVGVASLAAFLSLLYRMRGPVSDVMQSRVTLDGLGPAIDDVDELLESSRTPFLADGSRSAEPMRKSIEFRGVSFRYGADQPWALQDVTFDIPAGKTTAIVGESGAGKSTILSLLFRFQDPTHGQVEVDGLPISELRLSQWRGQLALMSQDVQLFHATIAENIAYGRPECSEDDVKRAAAVAHADPFIAALPDGYDTVVGERGLRLSGGQRQRIALARTIVREPDLLLLDEATNALDVESEQAFQLALDQFSHRRTVVVIAHRLATVRNADQIVVLSNGRVVEVGSPQALLKAGGAFARMFDLQQAGFGQGAQTDEL